ncbi:MAG: glycosyltransferase, partial [Yoonia sp.]|uniref:glycosyltransferase n=1 Tax=Yoonia sp. TaxID=2212373 RepID=UPI0027400E3E
DVETYNNVIYHRLKKPYQRGLSFLEYVLHAADVLTDKIRELEPGNVIAASNHINALPALIASSRLGLPFTYEVRGFWEISRLARDPDFSSTIEFAVSQQLEAFIARSADQVFTLTSQMRDDLVKRGVNKEKISLMPNGVAEEFVRSLPADRDLADKLNLPKECPVIGYIGSILEYEGLQDLAQACVGLAKRGVDFRLLLVGQEKPNKVEGTPITDEIRKIFKDAGIFERLIMPGRVPFSEVERYYSLIDIAPIPRRPYEVAHMVSPIKPLEAMAKAKAVVVSDVAALSDMVESGITGMVFRAGDADHLEEQLALLIADRSLIGRVQQAGQDFVKDSRTWRSICATAATNLDISYKEKPT